MPRMSVVFLCTVSGAIAGACVSVVANIAMFRALAGTAQTVRVGGGGQSGSIVASTSGSGPQIILYDARNEARLEASLTPLGDPLVSLCYPSGKPAIQFRAFPGERIAELRFLTDSGRLVGGMYLDADGTMREFTPDGP